MAHAWKNIEAFKQREGAGWLKRNMAELEAVPDDSDIAKQAKEVADREAYLWALGMLKYNEKRAQHEAEVTEVNEKKRKEHVAAIHADWKAAKVKTVDGQLDFFSRKPGRVADARRVEENKSMELLPIDRHVILMVDQDVALNVEDEYQLEPTLTWNIEGFTCWVYRSSHGVLQDAVGKQVKLVSCNVERPSLLAPMGDNAEWVVDPGKALAPDCAEVPVLPQKLQDIFAIIPGKSLIPAHVDRLIL